MGNIYIALLHYPVYDKNRRIVTTSVANMDVHDIARTARTYSVQTYYIVTPVRSQHHLVGQIIDHWRAGYGSSYNPSRKEAFEIVSLKDSLQEVIDEISDVEGERASIVVTGANFIRDLTPIKDLKKSITESRTPFLFIFGTGSGLTDQVIEKADYLMEPIRGQGEYNHLPVRAAVAVALDRLLGKREGI